MLFEKIQLEEDEKVATIVRKHWFNIFERSVGAILAALAPVLLFGALNVFGIDLQLSEYSSLVIFFYSLWVLICWMFVAYAWTDHYLDVWAITDRRIIKIDQSGFFNRQIGSFRLEKLQDMNVEVKGVVQTFLDFGTIEAQTASGSEEEFQGSYVPKPREIKSLILRSADERMRETRRLSQGV